MSDNRERRGRRERPGGGAGVVAGAAALLSLVAVGITLYGLWRNSMALSPEIGLPYLAAAGGGVIIAAVIGFIRDMSVSDIVEAMWDAALGLIALIGAMLKGICNFILGLFGWD
jgi:hypothetical protein